MTPIRHLGWTAFALIALVGCEAPAPPTPPTTPPGTAPAGAPKPASPRPTSSPRPRPARTRPRSSPYRSSPPSPKTKAEEPKKEGAAVDKLTDDEIAEIKKLPADEQPIALAQVTCPVSDDHLGAMAVPIKQVISGKTFFLCCAGCERRGQGPPRGRPGEAEEVTQAGSSRLYSRNFSAHQALANLPTGRYTTSPSQNGMAGFPDVRGASSVDTVQRLPRGDRRIGTEPGSAARLPSTRSLSPIGPSRTPRSVDQPRCAAVDSANVGGIQPVRPSRSACNPRA